MDGLSHFRLGPAKKSHRVFRIGSAGGTIIGVEKRYDYDSCIDDSATDKDTFSRMASWW